MSPLGVELEAFSISVHYKISKLLIFGDRGDWHMRWGLFCTKINSKQLLFEPFLM